MNKLKQIYNSIPGRILRWVLALAPAVLAILLAVYYITGPGEGYFHSDCSDSLYWANATYESGHVFDETYRYAGLLPFSASAWMVPLIQVFGFGMTAHNIAMIIFAVLFAGSIWFCCSSAGLEKGFCGIAVFCTFMMLSSSDKLREILWGHTIYYSVGLIILFYTAGLCIRVMNSFESRHWVRFGIFSALTAAICAGCATDGMQVIVLAALPVAGAVFCERIFCGDKLISKKTLSPVITLALVGAGTLAGLFLLKIFKGTNIEAGYADAYSGWSDVSAWADNAKAFVLRYFTLIGAVPEDAETLFAKESLSAIIRIGVGVVILVVPVLMLCFYHKLSSRGVKIILIAHFIESAAIMFGFICGKLSGANWRLTPMVGSAVLVTIIGARELWMGGVFSTKTDEKSASGGRVLVRIGALLCACLVLSSCISAKEIKKMDKDYGQDNYNHRLAAFLEEKGLEYGYATFWYSQAITVISESKVKCREVLAEKRGVYSDYYQSSRTWYVNQDYDKFFILLSINEYKSVKDSEMWQNALEYKLEDFTATTSEDEALGYGVAGFVITVFDRNVLDENVMDE